MDLENDLIKREKLFKRKLVIIRVLFIICIVIVILKISYLKYAHGDEYEKIAIRQAASQSDEKTLVSPRGNILDRNGNIMAQSNTYYNVIIDNKQIQKFNEMHKNKKIYENLPPILSSKLGFTLEEANEFIKVDSKGVPINNNNYLVIKNELTYTELQDLLDEVSKKGLSGVHSEEFSKRIYPLDNLAPQIVGFMRGDNGDGNWGLERIYNEQLTGVNGRRFSSYNDNGEVSTMTVEPIAGYDLVTTIDRDLQETIDQIAIKYHNEMNAVNVGIIVMNPNTGEILAMSEAPNFSNNHPGNISYISGTNFTSNYEAATPEEQGEMLYKVWRNFNVSDTFEPGSIYKPLVEATAIEESLVGLSEVFFCPGYKEFSDGTKVSCWHKIGHGNQTMRDGLTNSCNVVYMNVSSALGRSIYHSSQLDYGFGAYTNIDLPAESYGIINPIEQLNPVELATGAMGQGFNVTSIQAITALSAIANGGYLYTPYIVSQIKDSDNNIIKNTEPMINKKILTKETTDIVTNDMINVVENGTGKKLKIPGYTIAGKTGTAEQGLRNKEDYSVSFVGFLPTDKPQYIALGVVFKPAEYVSNVTSAVPMMKEVFETLISYYNIQPDGFVPEEIISNKTAYDYINKNVVSSIEALNKNGENYEIIGNGDTVVKQIPIPSALIQENATYYLTVENINNSALIEVPDVTGMDFNAGEELLINEGFRTVSQEIDNPNLNIQSETPTEDAVENTEETSTEKTVINVLEPKHEIISQMPASGVLLPPDTQIKLVVKRIQ
ncbi:MAG: penicillin-binding transpeptidase domain-containing protein [Lachnospirales bacterium]